MSRNFDWCTTDGDRLKGRLIPFFPRKWCRMAGCIKKFWHHIIAIPNPEKQGLQSRVFCMSNVNSYLGSFSLQWIKHNQTQHLWLCALLELWEGWMPRATFLGSWLILKRRIAWRLFVNTDILFIYWFHFFWNMRTIIISTSWRDKIAWCKFKPQDSLMRSWRPQQS